MCESHNSSHSLCYVHRRTVALLGLLGGRPDTPGRNSDAIPVLSVTFYVLLRVSEENLLAVLLGEGARIPVRS